MPVPSDPPSGTLVYETRNRVTVTCALGELYRLLEPSLNSIDADRKIREFANSSQIMALIEAGDAQGAFALGLTADNLPEHFCGGKMYDGMMAHQKRLASTGGICNMMTAAMVNRVFSRGSIEDPFLTDDERDEIMRRQKDYQKELFQIGLKDPNDPNNERIATNAVLKASNFGFEYHFRKAGAFAPGQFPDGDVVALLVTDRYLKLSIKMPEGSHAMAAVRQGRHYLLDPNFGLYRYDAKEQFASDLKRHITGYGATSYELHAAESLPLSRTAGMAAAAAANS